MPVPLYPPRPGCQGDDQRVCPDCQTPAEVRELAKLGCSAAAFKAVLF